MIRDCKQVCNGLRRGMCEARVNPEAGSISILECVRRRSKRSSCMACKWLWPSTQLRHWRVLLSLSFICLRPIQSLGRLQGACFKKNDSSARKLTALLILLLIRLLIVKDLLAQVLLWLCRLRRYPIEYCGTNPKSSMDSSRSAGFLIFLFL